MTHIVHSGRTLTKALVAFDIRWDGDLTRHGPVVWSMLVTDPEGRETVRLAYRAETGAFAGQFVDDVTTGRRVDVDRDADLDSGEITVRFPANVVGVAAEWPTWRAVITVDGDDVAEDVTTY